MKDLDTLNAEIEQHELNIALLRSEGEYEAAQFELGMLHDVQDEIMDGRHS